MFVCDLARLELGKLEGPGPDLHDQALTRSVAWFEVTRIPTVLEQAPGE